MDGTPEISIRWDNVIEIVTFKRDFWMYDDVRLEFRLSDNCCKISEDCVNFRALVESMQRRFPEIPADWRHEVTHPAFATNLRTLWKRA